MSDSHDVIVIGSGAGGGTLVHHLAPSGQRILLLERGACMAHARAAEHLPSRGAVRPALTAMANALRVGDHLMERLDARQPLSEAADVA